MSGSSWMGSVEDDVHNQDDDLESRISDSLGDTASGRSSLTDAIVSRVVETVRAGVIVTSENLGELAADLTSRYERLEQRLEAVAHQVEQQQAAGASGAPIEGLERFEPGFGLERDDRIDTINERLERLEALLTAAAAAPAPEVPAPVAEPVDLTPVWETLEALRHEVISRTEPQVATDRSDDLDELRTELAELRRTVVELPRSTAVALAEWFPQPQAPEEAAPSFSAVDDVLFRIDGIEALVRTGLSDLADLAASLPAEAPAPVESTVVVPAPDLSPVVEAVGARLAELRGALQARLDLVEEAAALQHEAVSARLAALHADAATSDFAGTVDQLRSIVADGVDAVSDRVGHTEERIAEQQSGLRTTIDYLAQLNDTYSRSLHEAVAAAGDRVVAEQARLEALVRDSSQQGHSDSRSVHEAIAAATERVVAEQGELRAAIERADAAGQQGARLLHEAIDAASHRLSEEVVRVRDLVEAGPDLSSVTTPLAEIGDAIAAARATLEASTVSADLSELREAVVAVRGTVTTAQQSLAEAVAEVRTDLTATVQEVGAATAQRSDINKAVIDRVVEQLAGFEHTAEHALEWSDEMGERLAVVEGHLAVGREQWQSTPARLAELGETVERTAADIAAISHWTAVHDAPEQLEQLAGSLDEKLAGLAEVVPALQAGLVETRTGFDQVSEALIGSLDGLRAHLTASGGFSAQGERLRELKLVVEALAADVRVLPVANGGARSADSVAIQRLQTTVEGLLARFDIRSQEATTRSATLEATLDRSIRELETQVKDVLGGIGVNNRTVRTRFDELSGAVSGLRGELSQVRSLRAEIDTLGAGLDALRNRVARENV